jgi:predicted adenine nucleotide alpha hydrolase (AANH) superfamily ATPase
MKLLFHACCAPCSTACFLGLKDEGLAAGLFWYNPNIHPFTEYQARKNSIVKFAAENAVNLDMDDEYGLRLFLKTVGTDPRPGDRCGICYTLRLEKTARVAAANNYNAFSTTLLCSPYQNHDAIRAAGEAAASDAGVQFFYRDFRPWFMEGQRIARDGGSYIQKYCGCVFSEEERYLGN